MNEELDALRKEIGRLCDKDAIVTLQTAYGYYVDKAQWDEAADLFARDATLEIAGRGLFRGADRIRAYLHALPPLEEGTVFNHMQLQPLITLDGDTAKGRWRAIMDVGFVGRESLCGEGTYENHYVREDGVWKIARLHFFVTYYVDYEKGWSHGGIPMGQPLPEMMPDEPQTVDYGSFPQIYIPPYHYPQPCDRQGVAPMNRAEYDDYVRAFNARDYDAVCDFYVQPPTMSFFGVDIRSREDLKTFYGFLHSYVHESVTVTRFASSDDLTAIDAIVRVEAYRDLDAETLAANGCGGFFPIRKGEVQEMRQFLFYTMNNGKFERVECAMPLAQ